MTFLGVSLGGLATLLGTFGAVIAALYLLRPRRPTLQVPFGALWASVLGRQAADSPWRRLRRLRSLLLQLTLLATLGLALADPRLPGCGGGGSRMVVVVGRRGRSRYRPVMTAPKVPSNVASPPRDTPRKVTEGRLRAGGHRG